MAWQVSSVFLMGFDSAWEKKVTLVNNLALTQPALICKKEHKHRHQRFSHTLFLSILKVTDLTEGGSRPSSHK